MSLSSAPPPASSPSSSPLLAVVTGGNGFLGWHLVSALLASPSRWRVRVFDVRPPREARPGVEYATGDLRRDADVAAALAGADVVLHAATAAPTAANSLDKGLMEAVNVQGTERVLRLAREAGARAVVYTSSASVVFAGRPLRGVDESTPYADPPADRYTETKIQGERLVLEEGRAFVQQQSSREGAPGSAAEPRASASSPAPHIPALALRPSGIFGEHDALAVPEIARNAAAGKLRFVLGDGKNLADWTYAGNVADAHVLAAEALLDPARRARVSGRAFFVTNDDPRPFWAFMGDVVEGLGYPRPARHIPALPVYLVALLIHYVIAPLLKPFFELKSDFTPFRVLLSTTDRVFSCEAAKKELGYAPKVPLDQAIQRALAFYPQLHKGADQQAEGAKKHA